MEPKNNYKVDEATALEEFERFLNLNELEFEGLDEEDAADFEKIKKRFIKAVMLGRLFINEEEELVYKPTHGVESLTFYEPTGAEFSSTDGVKKDYDYKRKQRLLGALTKTSAATFAKMKNRDLKVCDSILMLFLA